MIVFFFLSSCFFYPSLFFILRQTQGLCLPVKHSAIMVREFQECVMCQNFSWGSTSLLIPDREPMTDLSRDNTKVQLGEFSWGYLWNMGVGLLTGAEMTLQTVVSPGPSPSIDGSPQSWEFRALFTACRQLSRLESVCSRCISWSKPLPGSVAGFCFFR